MSFEDILREVELGRASGQKASFLNGDDYNGAYAKVNKKGKSDKRSLAAYGLGGEYGKMYFTKREAECMMWLLKGKTINGVATMLDLSPRTVEYYIKNMKTKTGCRTKFELIDLVHASEFTKNVDF